MEAMGSLQIFGLLLHASCAPYVRIMSLACIRIVPAPRNIFSTEFLNGEYSVSRNCHACKRCGKGVKPFIGCR